MNSSFNLKLTVTQFKIAYVLWTILGLYFGSALIFSTVKILLDVGIAFRKAPMIIGMFLLIDLLIIGNLTMFYVAILNHRRNFSKALNWIATFAIPLFIYVAFRIGTEFDSVTIGLTAIFVFLYAIVAWKQESYFNFRRAKEELANKN